MKIPGYTITNALIVLILGTTLVLFTSLPIQPTRENTWDGNTFGHLENQEVKKEK